MNELMARQQYKRTAIAAAVTVFLVSLGGPAFAQAQAQGQD